MPEQDTKTVPDTLRLRGAGGSVIDLDVDPRSLTETVINQILSGELMPADALTADKLVHLGIKGAA